MYKKIKPIPTYYDGIKYRSRLESRFAYYLDLNNIRYEYEAEGYTFKDMFYVPDFLLEGWIYIELKPIGYSIQINEKEWEKYLYKLSLFSLYIGKPLYICIGINHSINIPVEILYNVFRKKKYLKLFNETIKQEIYPKWFDDNWVDDPMKGLSDVIKINDIGFNSNYKYKEGICPFSDVIVCYQLDGHFDEFDVFDTHDIFSYEFNHTSNVLKSKNVGHNK